MSKYISESFNNIYGKESDKVANTISKFSTHLVENIIPPTINYFQSYFTRYGDDFVRKNGISSIEEFKEQVKNTVHAEYKLLNGCITESANTFNESELVEFTNNLKTVINYMTESLLYDNDYDHYSLTNEKNKVVRNNLHKPLTESERYELLSGARYFKEDIIANAKEAIKNNKGSITRVGGASAAGAGLLGAGIGIHNAFRDGSNQGIGKTGTQFLQNKSANSGTDDMLKNLSQNSDKKYPQVGLDLDEAPKKFNNYITPEGKTRTEHLQDEAVDKSGGVLNHAKGFGHAATDKVSEYGDHIKNIASATVDSIKNAHPAIQTASVLGLGLAAAATHHYVKNKNKQ